MSFFNAVQQHGGCLKTLEVEMKMNAVNVIEDEDQYKQYLAGFLFLLLTDKFQFFSCFCSDSLGSPEMVECFLKL